MPLSAGAKYTSYWQGEGSAGLLEALAVGASIYQVLFLSWPFLLCSCTYRMSTVRQAVVTIPEVQRWYVFSKEAPRSTQRSITVGISE